MKILNNNILCKSVEEKKSNSGLTLPNSKSYKVLKVVQVDDNINNVEKDNVVYVPKNGGFEVDIEGEPFQIINVKEIILIV